MRTDRVAPLEWALDVMSGRIGAMSYADLLRATEEVYREAQWREVPIGVLIAEHVVARVRATA